MFAKHLISQILITLDSGDKNALFILLDKNGTVHRKGNGNAEADLPLIQGRSTLGHFDAMLMTVNEYIFSHTGVIKMPDRVGIDNTLTIIFQAGHDIDYSFRVIYGQQSEGPPQELAEILINAVKLTEGWYHEQQSLQKEEEIKDKWKFWK